MLVGGWDYEQVGGGYVDGCVDEGCWERKEICELDWGGRKMRPSHPGSCLPTIQ